MCKETQVQTQVEQHKLSLIKQKEKGGLSNIKSLAESKDAVHCMTGAQKHNDPCVGARLEVLGSTQQITGYSWLYLLTSRLGLPGCAMQSTGRCSLDAREAWQPLIQILNSCLRNSDLTTDLFLNTMSWLNFYSGVKQVLTWTFLCQLSPTDSFICTRTLSKTDKLPVKDVYFDALVVIWEILWLQ